ncbi:hypothetical protein Glove_303g129 [Diversispora epigaea]|uniref:Uncharacterized protein n=1 Tax=Diversispora epigaea TaxID=1348612 RepID=A0A397HW64_9GLOM|nr:hypothetical protein Glove_303g129 [Diversispora epigaea]
MVTIALCEYMAGSRRARRNRTGAQYFDEFRTHFWERPEDEFDRIRNINTTNRRRNRDMGGITPAPSIEEVVRKLGQTSSINIPFHNLNVGNAKISETLSLQTPPYGATDK